MPVEFLTDDEAAAYGRYAGPPSQADPERVFFLDDEDRKLVDLRRGDHMKAGFALQMVTVRWLGTFLEDPLDVPGEVLDFVAGQLGIGGRPSKPIAPSGLTWSAPDGQPLSRMTARMITAVRQAARTVIVKPRAA